MPLDLSRYSCNYKIWREFYDAAVAGAPDDTTTMDGDGGVEHIAAERTQPRKRAFLVGSGKLAVSGYVRRENCRELPGLGHECPPTDEPD